MLQRGFSLVELSIVLVILGLLTGGILAGQSLIRASELRAVTAELSRYTVAARAFKDKYFAIPGDMPNATSFWGAQNGTDGLGASCDVTSTTTATCNGNGDGQVNTWIGAYAYETFRYWQHLANAGLIEGAYSGKSGAGSVYHALIGTNVPRSRMSNVGYSINWRGTITVAGGGWYPDSYGNAILAGGAVTDDLTYSAFLKPEELWNIDTKMDDGRPAYGTIMTDEGGAGLCATSATRSAADYALTLSTPLCFIIVKSGF